MKPTVPVRWFPEAHITAIVGHFGSGKTEVALNVAKALSEQGLPFYLADLDIVDPYGRSRECKDMIEEMGGIMISSDDASFNADIPALPAEVASLFDDQTRHGIMDIGGDARGAKVLSRYKDKLKADGARLLYVVNANRPFTQTAEDAVKYLREIEEAAGMEVDGIINNSHLLDQTTAEDILIGAELAEEISQIVQAPVICHAVEDRLVPEVEDKLEAVLPMKVFMSQPWERR